MYLSAKHIGVKRDQDRTSYDTNKIILCDGIGEFNDSARAAEITIDNLLMAERRNEIISYIERSVNQITTSNINGGTTLIYACVSQEEIYNCLRIAYVGNGSVFHLCGDFYELPASYLDSNKPYRYSNLLVPHVDKEGVLMRHISHSSNPEDYIPSFIEISLTGIYGDIILFFSDGISSLEDDIVIADEQNRMWRNQSEIVVIIINNLHEWLKNNYHKISQVEIDMFIETTLVNLKKLNKLEDDASMGLIITDQVLDYYNKCYHVA